MLVMIAAILGALAVVAGAFGAHGIKHLVTPEMLAVWQTAAHYQLVHAVLLVALGLWKRHRAVNILVPYVLITAGIVLFCGSLYALVALQMPMLGAITPIGGLCLLAGWVSLAIVGWRDRSL
jgi:uncharacterized membrane protein YgdD (TMEM256/DUF423 family)